MNKLLNPVEEKMTFTEEQDAIKDELKVRAMFNIVRNQTI